MNERADERRRRLGDQRKSWRGGRREEDTVGRPVILVVDDHADSRELLVTILASAHIASREVSTVEDALRRMREPPLPCAVIVDLAVPDRHGTDLIRRIRGDAATGALPIVVVSAAVRESDRRAAIDAGATVFLAKPVLPDLLLQAIRHEMS